MRRLSSAVFLGCFLLVPTLAHAQATLTGVVRDSSGAVLPGVTVEASSPVLIEKVRRVITDTTGQYRLIDLPPGSYEITFTLSGFSTVKREGVEVTGSGVIPINIEMRVGNLAETITVTGETPIVDTQSTRRETVLTTATINALPATRTYGALLDAIPALMTSTGFSARTTPEMTFFTAHGGRSNEGRVMIDGLNVAAAFSGGGVSTFTYDVANAEEMQVLVSGGLGESEGGGPSINLVPRSGGNTFRGSGFWSGAGDWSRGENIDDYLRSIGIRRGPALVNSWDLSGTYGGPIKRNKLWFFVNVRNYGNARVVEGAFANLNAGDPTKWLYERDDNVEARNAERRDIYSFRLTSQITPRNKVSFSHEYQHRCSGSALTQSPLGDQACRVRESNWVAVGTATSSPEAWAGYHDFPYNVTQATWSSPVTSRLLLEAGFSRFHYLWAGFGQAPPDGIMNLIPVTEQSTRYNGRANFVYRGIGDFADNDANPNNWRASASYVTGAHNMKLGYQGAYQRSETATQLNEPQIRYRFNNGIPNQFTYRLARRWEQSNRTMVHSLYVQDQWTRGRVTLQGALRYDRASSWSPAEHNGTPVAGRFNAEPIGFPRTVGVTGYHDLTPRMGVAYDLFGTGKTALKANLGKYLQNATNDETFDDNNPAARIVTVASREWQDGNGNFVADCDLLNPARQDNLTTAGDVCGSVGGNARNFGNPDPNLTVVNQAILGGWGVRPWDWQLGLSVQQEVIPRVSVEVGYNRRWFGNFFVTDNQLRGPEDYEPWFFTAPLHPNLPGGGGYTVTYYAITEAAFARGARNFRTFETDFGPARTAYWHGMDVTGNARLRNGLVFQGGTSTGRGVRDTCEITAKLPELLVTGINPPINQQFESCHQTDRWVTTFRGLASYTVPRVGVLVSATMRSLASNSPTGAATNGTSLNANYNVPNTVVRQILGRLPAGGTVNGNQTVDLLIPGQEYGDDRIDQVDMRFAKILRFGRRRADIGVDLYNLFNTNDTVTYQENFDYATNGATWLQPLTIVQPRFVRINVTVNF